jgi:AcrR family transcriptional regulator
MVRAVAADGYEATTVRQLSALAGVSTRTLYDLFADGKRECFLSTYDEAMRGTARRVALAYISERRLEQRLPHALEAFLHAVREDPAAARLVLVEAFAAGPRALERIEHTHRLFEGMVDLSFRQTTRGAPSPLVVKGVVAGIAHVARVRFLDGRASELEALADELWQWVVSYRSPTATRLAQLERSGSSPLLAVPVAASSDTREIERARILDAVAHLAARDGYASLSVAAVASAAGVRRRCFHAHFDDVQTCFMAALERLTERALSCLLRVGAAGQGWPGGLHRAICALCDYLARNPLHARLAFVEVFAPGTEGVRLRVSVIAEVAERLRASAPAEQRPSELAAEASVGAVWAVIHHHVTHEAADRLPGIASQLSFMALAPVLGAQEAVQAICAEHTHMHSTTVSA